MQQLKSRDNPEDELYKHYAVSPMTSTKQSNFIPVPTGAMGAAGKDSYSQHDNSSRQSLPSKFNFGSKMNGTRQSGAGLSASRKEQLAIQFAPPSSTLVDQGFQQTLKKIKKDFKGIFMQSGLEMLSKSTRCSGITSTLPSRKRSVFENPSSRASVGPSLPTEMENQQLSHEDNPFGQRASSVSFSQAPGSRADRGGDRSGKILNSVLLGMKGRELPSRIKRTKKLGPEQRRVSVPSSLGLDIQLNVHGAAMNSASNIDQSPFKVVPYSTLTVKKQTQASSALEPLARDASRGPAQAPPDSRDSMRVQNCELKERLREMEKCMPRNQKPSLIPQEGSDQATLPYGSQSGGNADSRLLKGYEITESDRHNANSNQSLGARNRSGRKRSSGRDKSSKRAVRHRRKQVVGERTPPSFDGTPPGRRFSPSYSGSIRSSRERLPKIPENKQGKNRMKSIEHERNFAQDPKWLQVQKIQNQERKSNYIRRINQAQKGSKKATSKIERNKMQEALNQSRHVRIKEEQKAIEHHHRKYSILIQEAKDKERALLGAQDLNESSESDEVNEQMKSQMHTTTLSQDSAGKNVGVLGRFISRIIDDQDKRPEDHKYYLEEGADTVAPLSPHKKESKLDEQQAEGQDEGANSPSRASLGKASKGKQSKWGRLAKLTNAAAGATGQTNQGYVQIQDGERTAQTFPAASLQMQLTSRMALQKKGTMLNSPSGPLDDSPTQPAGAGLSRANLNRFGTASGTGQPQLQLGGQASKERIRIKRDQRSGEMIQDARELPADEVADMEQSRSTFARKFPEFTSGMTPFRARDDSDMASEEREEQRRLADSKAHVKQLHRKRDFEELGQRQQQFRDLMETSVPSAMGKSEIIPIESTHTSQRFENFPFAKEGAGRHLVAYNQKTATSSFKAPTEKEAQVDHLNRKLNLDSRESHRINERFSEGLESAYGDDLPDKKTQMLAFCEQISGVADETHRAKNQAIMEKFLGYVTTENFSENIQIIQERLESRVLNKGFKGYDDIPDPELKQFAKHIHRRRDFYGMMKLAASPRCMEQYIDDPMMAFIKHCQQPKKTAAFPDGDPATGVPVPSLLQRINNGSLNLIGYYLNPETCQAFAQAFAKFADAFNDTAAPIESIFLDNNALRDDGLGKLIAGMFHLEKLKKLVCMNNEMNRLSTHHLEKLLLRPEPNQLDELRLTNCKLSPSCVNELLEVLRDEERCQVRRLGLVKADFGTYNSFEINDCINNLLHLLEESTIIDLDLSWNGLGPDVMFSVAEKLSHNRRLQHLNLSHNNFKELTDFSGVTQRKWSLEDEHEIARNLCKFIKYNSRLLHFDLSYTGLTKPMLVPFAAALRRAKSLLCLHLSGNPGITDDKPEPPGKGNGAPKPGAPKLLGSISTGLLAGVQNQSPTGDGDQEESFGEAGRRQLQQFEAKYQKDELRAYMHGRAHCMPVVEALTVDVVQRDNFAKRKDGYSVPNSLAVGIRVKEHQSERFKKDAGRLESDPILESEVLLFDRILGHKKDLPGWAQWRQIKNKKQKCWICDNQIYSLVFWSKKIGWACEGQITTVVEEMVIQKLEEIQARVRRSQEHGAEQDKDHALAYSAELGAQNSSPDAPVLYGQFTNWHPVKMMPIEEYCDLIDGFQPNFVAHLQKSGKCRRSINNYDDLNPQELEDYDLLKCKYKKFYYTRYFFKVIENNLRYKRPNLVHQEHLNPMGQLGTPINQAQILEALEQPVPAIEKSDKLYVFPCFMKPGKHYFMVRQDPPCSGTTEGRSTGIPQAKLTPTQDDGQRPNDSASSLRSSAFGDLDVEYYSHATIAPFRTEDVPGFIKTYGSITKEIVFKKNKSVFKDWKEDTDNTLKKSCQHDFECWKLSKFMQKDPEDIEKVEELITKHIAMLKTLHIYTASKSLFPHVDVPGFKAFIDQFNIIDANLKQSMVDTIFSNGQWVDPKEKPGGVQQDCLLRFQFLEVLVRLAEGKYKKSGRVKTHSDSLRMLIEKDLKPHCQEALDEWDGFRREKLWTIDVNEMFKINLASISQLMEKFFQPRAKWLTQADAISIFTLSEVLTEKDALLVYGMSKQPNPAETKEIKKHKLITNLTELIEMIGRAAEVKYKQEKAMTMVQKIGLVMDQIFPSVGRKTEYPAEQQEQDESQSDEDY